MTRRTIFDRLLCARAALDRAVASGADPWRVAELRQRHDYLAEAAADAPDVLASASAPAPRGRAAELPLEWVDESGRPRRGPVGGGGAA